MCQGKCKATACMNNCSPAEAHLRKALQEIEALARQHLAPTAIDPRSGALSSPAMAVIASRAAEGLKQLPASVQLKRIRTRADSGVIKGAAITQRMTDICGCNGVYDCDCVSAENQATRELWTEHNEAQRLIGELAA